jgi:hypothetical protein
LAASIDVQCGTAEFLATRRFVVDESLLGYRWHNCAALVVDDDVQKPAVHMQLPL